MNADAPTIEVLDAKELAARWRVPESWVRSYSRARCPKDERIPHLPFREVRPIRVWLARA